MLKNKTKEELLEVIYKTNDENYNLQIANEKQAEILKSISKAYNPKCFFARLFNRFALPFKILQILKTQNEYFYNLELSNMNLTREQVIAANKAILDFENKRISTDNYKEYVIKMLGLPKQCSSCSDVAGRLHDDFQKRVIAEMVSKYPDLLPTPPTFKSGQFCGDTYKKWAQTYHFKGLLGLLSNMKTSALNAKQRGALEQSKLMLEDCETLKNFIAFRKFGLVENEETTGKVALDSKNEALEIEIKDTINSIKILIERVNNAKTRLDKEAENLLLAKIKELCLVLQQKNRDVVGFLSTQELKNESDAIVKEVEGLVKFGSALNDFEVSESEDKEFIIAAENVVLPSENKEIIESFFSEVEKEKKLYNDEDALALQNEGMKLEDIASYYGVSAATISRKLTKYKEILSAEKPNE
jgi:hypothetical protein